MKNKAQLVRRMEVREKYAPLDDPPRVPNLGLAFVMSLPFWILVGAAIYLLFGGPHP